MNTTSSAPKFPAPPSSIHRKAVPLCLFAVLLLLGWTAAVGVSFWYNISRLEQHAVDSARIQARTAYEKDVTYRRWNSWHNGVYAAVIPGEIEPNPYLPEKGRVIVDQEGKKYTKINPAFMTRLVHELGALDSGVIGKITSNKPLRKGNEPDAWEKSALRKLENKEAAEVSEVMNIDGQPYLRLMGALKTEPSCMACHAHQGYKVGDVRGGIGVAVPMPPFISAMKEQQHTLFGTHLILWLVGLSSIGLGARQIAGDVRDRERAEAELRVLASELENRVAERTAALKVRQMELEAFMDNSSAGVYIKGLNGFFTLCNSQFASILGHTPDTIIGCSNEDVMNEETARHLTEHEETIIHSGRSAELKNGLLSRQGTRYSCFAFPLKEDGKVVGVGGLLMDMTERDKAELLLRNARDAAEKASRAKSYFLANMSHEIRTPLNGIIGMADLLLRTRLDPDQASMAAAVKTSGDCLLLVLNDVLDISKIEAGKLTLEHIPFRLRDMLFDAIKGLTPIAYKKNIELILHVSPIVPESLIGDHARIRQVILNLVNNALKFTEQGEVVISVQVVSQGEKEARLRFSVTDTGIGIPLEKQDSIFRAFEQVDSSTTRKYGGSGLGLAICTRILDLMDSKIKLKSHEGFGSSFWFELNFPVDQSEDLVPKPLVCAEALKGLRALIVDDNSTNLRILGETLTNWGMEVCSSSSADEAFALVGKATADRPFNIILTDLQMPEKDGVDLLRMIRSDNTLAHLPIILLSSGNLSDSAHSDLKNVEFFAAKLDKPVRPEVLMRGIASALNMWESYDVQELKREEEQKQADSEKPSLDVLLAEDVEMNQMVASRMLQELGHTVTIVGDGKAAVSALTSQPYDIIFMDIQMPVMDGVQATLTIREMERHGLLDIKTNIIAMTANALKSDKAKYLAVGMDAYLAKPILLEDLRNAIDEVMDNSDAEYQTPDTVQPQFAPTWSTMTGSLQNALQHVAERPKSNQRHNRTAVLGAKCVKNKEESQIDWALLARSFSGNTEFIVNSMNLYMRDAPKLLQEAFDAAERTDNATLTVSAHSLKGITGYFTRGETYDLCYVLEELGRENSLPDRKEEVSRVFSDLNNRVSSLLEEMKMYIARNSD